MKKDEKFAQVDVQFFVNPPIYQKWRGVFPKIIHPCYSFQNLLKDFLFRKILAGQEKKPSFALVANKIDLEHLRAIKSDRHHKFAQDHGLLTYALSAKTGEGVVLCVQKIAADLLGIRLTKQEQEQHGAVVKAEIVQYKQEAALPRNPQTSTASAVCAVM